MARGEEALRRYFDWAQETDRFSPIRVETEFEVEIPDPASPGHDLVASNGRPARYRGLVDILVEDPQGARWIVTHRFSSEAWAEMDRLVLDEDDATNCWTWELYFIGMTIAGTIVNELRVSNALAGRGDADRFRRTFVPRGREELAHAGRRLALVALDMTDPAIGIYPTPSWGSCSGCSYRAPCVAMSIGADPASILTSRYRQRTEEFVREGQLGRIAWSVGRGARPRKFGEGQGS